MVQDLCIKNVLIDWTQCAKWADFIWIRASSFGAMCFQEYVSTVNIHLCGFFSSNDIISKHIMTRVNDRVAMIATVSLRISVKRTHLVLQGTIARHTCAFVLASNVCLTYIRPNAYCSKFDVSLTQKRHLDTSSAGFIPISYKWQLQSKYQALLLKFGRKMIFMYLRGLFGNKWDTGHKQTF